MPASDTQTPLLQARGIRKAFAGVRVLEDVDFDLRPGEVHALLGENGAGKSTLLKIFGGVHRPDGGTVMMDGTAVSLPTPQSAATHGISLIHQEPLTFPDLDVTENIFIGHQSNRRSRLRPIAWKARYREAQRLLDTLGVNLDPRARMFGLSTADQQMVEMAGALSQNARVLLMDEPTASLTPDEAGELFRIVERLRRQGTGIVFISHRLEEVFQISDRITVLRDGHFIATRNRADTSIDEVIRMMVGRPLETFFQRARAEPGKPLLQVEGLCRPGRFEDISFDLRAGEIVGMAGLVGAGRTDVARALFGIRPAEAGNIRVRGAPAAIRRPADAIRLGMACVPEDRQHHGLVLPFTVTRNTTLASLRRLFPRGRIRPATERDLAERYRRELAIELRTVEQPTRELSGGNQQKVVLSKWLLTEPEILILDEPTRGIDVGAKQEVHRLMGELCRQGKAILLISSDLLEILALSDRILVLREGRLTGRFAHDEATAEKVMNAATGQTAEGAAPQPASRREGTRQAPDTPPPAGR